MRMRDCFAEKMSPTKLVFAELRFVGVVIVRHADAAKLLAQDAREHHFASGDDANLGRVSWLADDSGGSPGTHLAEYTYLGLGRTVRVDYTEPDLRYDLDPDNDGTHAGIDAFGRVVDLQWIDYAPATDVPVVRIKHGYDRVSNRLWREDPIAAASSKHLDELYAYDGVNRLTDLDRGNLVFDDPNPGDVSISSKNFAEQWGLDATGNWTSFKQDDDGSGWDLEQTRDHTKANEIDEIDSSSTHIAHDATGNMTKLPQPDDWSDHYHLTYDAWNRLVKVEETVDEQLQTVAEYEYDGGHRRTLKTVSGSPDVTHHFYYSRQWQVLEERVDTSTDADRQYVWGRRYIDDLILRDRDTSDPKNGVLDERLYALQDANFNVVALTDEIGDIEERYIYTAYGTPTVLEPDFDEAQSGTAYDWEYLYTGRRLDDETGLYYYRARYYDAELGRFVSRDPIVYRGKDLCLYRYVWNNPTNRLDPVGLEMIWEPPSQGPNIEVRPQDGITPRRPMRPGTIPVPDSPPIPYPGLSPMWPGLPGIGDGWPDVDDIFGTEPPTRFRVCKRLMRTEDTTMFMRCMINFANFPLWRPLTRHDYIDYDNGEEAYGLIGWESRGALPTREDPSVWEPPYECKPCYRDRNTFLVFGQAAGAVADSATDADILDCIRNAPARRDYTTITYNCQHWVEETYNQCGLNCSYAFTPNRK